MIRGLTVGMVILAAPLLAHHSFAAEYDEKKPVTLKGVVTKVEWSNPHARFYVDVKDDKGNVTNWNLELASPNVLVRNGWKQKFLAGGGCGGSQRVAGEGWIEYGERAGGHFVGWSQGVRGVVRRWRSAALKGELT